MKYFKTAAMALGLTLLGAALTSSAFADESNKKTVITFSGPVEIPGVHLSGWGILPAGTYVFKLLDSQSDRHIVQIFNKDETIVYATILAIPNYRLKATDKTVITFRERPAGEPEALRAWFYPGDNYGQEFVYGKAKAMELAKTSNTPVLFTQVETVETTEPIRSADHVVVVALKAAPVMAVQPSGEEVATLDIVAPLPAMETTAAAPALPATGSNVPLIALLGLASLGGAIGLGALAKRSN
jgi:LPXTG-motif cell wall-anchored protein